MYEQISMKRFLSKLIGLCLIASSFSLQAQKVKKEGLGYFNYQQPRASSALDQAKLFTIHISTEEGGSFRKDVILEEIGLTAFKRIEDRNNADFMISIEELPFKFGKEKKKSISGGENGATSYYYAGTIDYNYLLKILNPAGEEIYRKISRGSVKTSGRSSTSLTDAHRNYIKDKNKFKENCAKEAAKSLGKAFKEEFTDVDKTVHLRVVFIKAKKFDYEGYDAAYTDLIQLYEILNVNNEQTDETKQLKESCVTFWLEFATEVEPENKKARVTTEAAAAAHYNSGLAYFFCKEYALATEQFEKAASYDNRVVAGIMNWIYISKLCAERVENH